MVQFRSISERIKEIARSAQQHCLEKHLHGDRADELIDHWQRLKREPSLSLELGRRSQSRAMAEHGYEHRAARILAAIYG